MKQANLGLTIEELIARQDWLQEQVRDLVARRGLLEIAAGMGTPAIVGSYQSGLMVWPDIDFTVTAPGVPDLEAAMVAATRLMLEAGAHKMMISDRRKKLAGRLPQGIYLGPDLVDAGTPWQVDIWVVDEETARERAEVSQRLIDRLTDATRRSILAIKQVAAASDHYHRGVDSVDVYAAVLDHGVTTPDEFVAWLALSGRSL